MMQLNAEQRRAAEGIERSSLIISPGGCGKTAVFAAKVAEIQRQRPDKHILALSFTKKATAELAGRIENLTNVTVLNLCQFFYRILRANGFSAYTVLTDNRSRTTAMSFAIAEAKLADKVTEQEALEALDKNNLSGDMKTIAGHYFKILKKQRLMDFNCMAYFCLELLQERPAVGERIRRYFSHVLVDEAMDLNDIQFQIITTLFPSNHNLSFFGHDFQSIYSFRGSRSGVLQAFQEFYQADVYELSVNYRSSPEIVAVANKVAEGQTPMDAFLPSKGLSPVFQAAASVDKEAELVVSSIKERIKEGYRLSDMAILYRSLFAVTPTVEALLQAHIPFHKIGACADKWQRHPYSYLYNLLQLAVKPEDATWKKCAGYFGINESTFTEIKRAARKENVSVHDYLLQSPAVPEDIKNHIAVLLESVSDDAGIRNAVIAAWDEVLKPFFDVSDDSILEEYLSATESYKTVSSLLDDIKQTRKRYTELEKYLARKDADAVQIMSIHSSKGLQYPIVIIVGASDDIMPDSHEGSDIEGEERHIAYVSVSRAMDQLHVFCSVKTSRNKETKPSRYFAGFFNNK